MRIEAFEEPGEAGEATLGVGAGVRPVTTRTEPLPPPVNPPNVIVITADDLGYADLGFTGATEISTPESTVSPAKASSFPTPTPLTPCAVLPGPR